MSDDSPFFDAPAAGGTEQEAPVRSVLPGAPPGAPVPGLRAQRRARRRRRRRNLRIASAVVVLLLAAGIGLGVGLSSSHPHHAAPVVGRGQQTLLLGIGEPGQPALSAAVLGAAPNGAGAALLVPPATVVDGPGGSVGGSYGIAPPAEFAGAVSDLLGITVDATWRLAPAGLAALVDQVGGIQVDVDEAINTTGLVLNAGPQQLAGPQAAAYATYQGSETQQALLNRTRLVLDGVLAKLPPQAALTPLLGSLAANSTSTWSAATLAGFLSTLKASSVAENESILPVTPLDTGGATPSYALNPGAAHAAITAAFGPSLLKNHGAVGTRVQIVNDSGRPNLATSARAKLSAAGLTFVRAINDSPFHQFQKSQIQVFDSSAASIAFGHRVAAALGLPDAPVTVSQQKTSVADAIAILADDYTP